MGIVIQWHPKMKERLVDIFLAKHTKEGPDASREWTDRTLPEELKKELVPIIHKRNGK